MKTSTIDFYEKKFEPKILDLFKTDSEEPYLTYGGATYRVVSAEFKELLWKQHFLEFGQPPSCCKVKQTIKTLYMYGKIFAPVKKVYNRFAKIDDAVFIDMCTPDSAAVKITEKSVTVGQNTQAKFIRSKVQRPIGAPVINAVSEYFNLLKKYIPFKTEDDFILFVSWLLNCINLDGGYPVLFLLGEQGSAKSTTCKLIKDLLDASSVLLRNLPKSMKELMITATNDYILCFDNISKISDAQSDNLCKLATGAAFTTRRLYSTVSEVQIASNNPCVINGISCFPTRQDLLDRSLIVSLDFIAPDKRKTDNELMKSWENDRPLIFGALCQAASAALRNYNSVSEKELPRMADFAKWVIAAEENLPWKKGLFMETMRNLRIKIVEDALDADPVAMAVLKLMKNRDEWSGSATSLLAALESCIDQDRKKYPGFPKIANHLSRQLSRISAFLREKSILVKKRHSGVRFIEITKINPQSFDLQPPVADVHADEKMQTVEEIFAELEPAESTDIEEDRDEQQDNKMLETAESEPNDTDF